MTVNDPVNGLNPTLQEALEWLESGDCNYGSRTEAAIRCILSNRKELIEWAEAWLKHDSKTSNHAAGMLEWFIKALNGEMKWPPGDES